MQKTQKRTPLPFTPCPSTPNPSDPGSNPPTRSLTGPKHVKLHKMLENTCKNPEKSPKITPRHPKCPDLSKSSQNVPNPSPSPPKSLPKHSPTVPKSLAHKGFKPLGVKWKVLARFWKAQKLPQGSQTLPQTLQNGTKINEKSVQKNHYIFNVCFN